MQEWLKKSRDVLVFLINIPNIWLVLSNFSQEILIKLNTGVKVELSLNVGRVRAFIW